MPGENKTAYRSLQWEEQRDAHGEELAFDGLMAGEAHVKTHVGTYVGANDRKGPFLSFLFFVAAAHGAATNSLNEAVTNTHVPLFTLEVPRTKSQRLRSDDVKTGTALSLAKGMTATYFTPNQTNGWQHST